MPRTITDQYRTKEVPQEVYNVFECDAWLSYSSMEHKASCVTLEEAIDLIMKNGEFRKDCDMDYVREFLTEHLQTPLTGINYCITVAEVGEWD